MRPRKGIAAAGNWIVDRVKMIDAWPAEERLANVISVTRGGGGGAHNVLIDLARMKAPFPLVGIGFVYASVFELLTLPISFWSSYVLEHRYGLSNQTLGRWVWRRVKSYLVGGPIGLVLLLGLYVLLWYGGAWWWVWATAGWLLVTLMLGQLLPVVVLPLFYKVTRLDDPALLERLQALARGTGLNVEGIYRLHLSAETRKANAALAGLGRTRRVLLGDPLLPTFAAK